MSTPDLSDDECSFGHGLRVLAHDRDIGSWAPQTAYKELSTEVTSWGGSVTIVSGPELTYFTILAHDAEARDRDLFVAVVMLYITIVMVDRDMPNWAIFLHSFDVEACTLG